MREPSGKVSKRPGPIQFAAGTGIKDSITVKVAGEPKGLSEFTMVKVTNLIATTWEVGANHGVSFRADRIEVIKASV